MHITTFDHLAVVAPTLERGVAWVEERLGVMMGPGGKHPKMGTHNRLLALGATSFLEVIAIDPDAPSPGRPRWFELDRMETDAEPRLATWVVGTTRIRDTVASSTEDHGVVEHVTRNALRWSLTIPTDGSLPLEGVLPALIEWEGAPHPAAGMKAAGCALRRLALFHPEPERITRLFAAIGFDDGRVGVREGPPALCAEFDTPGGPRRIGEFDRSPD